MSNPNPTNISASVLAKLKNIADKHKTDYSQLVTRYCTERFLYRLSISEYRERFVLKGGSMFVIWQKDFTYRATLDTDMLCFGDTDIRHLQSIFTEVAQITPDVKDGIRFDTTSIIAEPITQNTRYVGTRIKFNCYVGSFRTTLQFDIGVGDVISPKPKLTEYPALLGNEAPLLLVYPMETALAEKIEAMITLGMLNSRMKDFYDMWLLSERFNHDYAALRKAIVKTFKQRSIPLPTTAPTALTDAFAESPDVQKRWEIFLTKNKPPIQPEVSFPAVIERISEFLLPVLIPSAQPPVKWIAANGWQE